MSERLSSVVTLALCLAALPRLRELLPGVDAGRRAVATAVVTLAASAVALTFPGERALYALTGVPHIGDLVGRAFLMVAAVAAQCIFLFAAEPAQQPRVRLRRRVQALLAALAVLLAAFTLAPTHDTSADYLVVYGGEPLVAVFVVTFTAFLGWCFADVLTAWSRLERRTSGSLHTGLRTLAAGAAVGLGYVVLRLTGQVALLAGWPGVVASTRIGCLVTGSVAALLAVAAVSWPAVSEASRAVHEWSRSRARLRQLYPLWSDLTEVVPHVALERPRPPTRELISLLDVRWRLYRRVIEIHDARLALRAYADAPSRRTRTAPAAEARRLARAVAAARRGAAVPESVAGPAAATVADDIDREAEWLSNVAREYRTLTRSRPARAVAWSPA
ncbi:MAB_1171c family putative transporter [Kineococcus terrestris]|uniref:MAB_1171c family putative transporter n=1 Tax=Kineococcus terrestris TaxID=2044856 RepID=UPI0034DB256C